MTTPDEFVLLVAGAFASDPFTLDRINNVADILKFGNLEFVGTAYPDIEPEVLAACVRLRAAIQSGTQILVPSDDNLTIAFKTVASRDMDYFIPTQNTTEWYKEYTFNGQRQTPLPVLHRATAAQPRMSFKDFALTLKEQSVAFIVLRAMALSVMKSKDLIERASLIYSLETNFLNKKYEAQLPREMHFDEFGTAINQFIDWCIASQYMMVVDTTRLRMTRNVLNQMRRMPQLTCDNIAYDQTLHRPPHEPLFY